MAIAFVQSKSAVAAASPLTVTMNAAPTTGNVLVCGILSGSNSAITLTGWTAFTAVGGGSGGSARAYQLFWKIAGAGESATVSATNGSNFGSGAAIAVAEYSGVDTAQSPTQLSQINASGTVNTPTVTPTASKNAVAVGIISVKVLNNSFSAEQINASATGVTEREDIGRTASGTGASITLFDKFITGTTGTYVGTATSAAANVGAGSLLFFYEATASGTAPVITSSAATSVLDTNATGNGNVTSDGGATVTERGFVVDLSTASAPTTVTNLFKYVGTGTTGSFSGLMTTLTPGVSYQFRPYATNSVGTSYGTAQTFTTTTAQYLGTADDFNDNTLATQWDTTLSGDRYQVTEKNQRLEMTHINQQYNTVLLTSAGDFTAKQVEVWCVDPGKMTSGSSHSAQFILYKDANNKLWMEAGNLTLSCWKVVGGVQTQIGASITYSGTTYKYWRIYEASGTLYMDTSADRITWTNRWTVLVSALWAVTSTKPGFVTGNWQNVSGDASYAYWDDFNGGGTPTSDTFSWMGYTWQRRQATETGGPSYNGQYLPANATVDGSGYLNLSITNPTGTSPYGAEIYSITRGQGYGTYTVVYDGALSTMHKSIVFGGLYTYDSDTSPTNLESDVAEISAWDNPAGNVRLNHTYFINSAGVKTSVEDGIDMTTDTVTTHRMIWSASSIIWDSFVGTGTSGTLLFRTTRTANIPVPGQERMQLNIWVFSGNGGTPSTATATTIKVRSLTYSSSTTDPGTSVYTGSQFFNFF